MNQPESPKTAAVLVIGDEILSGRTQDSNSNHIARFLALLGIDLKEIRVVGDEETRIVIALNVLRTTWDFVFTTGGIGPTHDDITADAVAKAFGVGIAYHPEALKLLQARYPAGELNAARKRMARVPLGAALVRNRVSAAPGFYIGNVFVLAGVPAIMRAMLEEIEPLLPRGRPVMSITVAAEVAEGRIAPGLAAIQKGHSEVTIGSYPYYRDGGFGVQLVARGRDGEAVEAAAQAIEAMLAALETGSRRL